jgi:hypothetical protein
VEGTIVGKGGRGKLGSPRQPWLAPADGTASGRSAGGAECVARSGFNDEGWGRACTAKEHPTLTRGTASGIGRSARTGEHCDGPQGITECGQPAKERAPRGVGADFKASECSPPRDRAASGRRERPGLRGRRGSGATRDVVARRGVGSPQLCQCTLFRTLKTQKNWIGVLKVVNRRVVDLTTLFNFYKGSRVFFSMVFAGTACQLWMSPRLSEQELLSVDLIFRKFPLKIWNANLHESCVPRQIGQLSYW